MNWAIFFGGAAFLAVVLVAAFLIWVNLSPKASPKLKERWGRIGEPAIVFLAASPATIFFWLAFWIAIRKEEEGAALFTLFLLAGGIAITVVSCYRALRAWCATS